MKNSQVDIGQFSALSEVRMVDMGCHSTYKHDIDWTNRTVSSQAAQ